MSRKKRKNRPKSASPPSQSVNTTSRRRILVATALAVALLGIAVVSYRSWMGWGARPPAQQAGGYGEAVAEATFVGRQACAACHPREVELWRGSDHDLAMQAVDEKTVLGDFDNATFTYFGVTSTFFKRDGKFFVRTDGPDGELHEYEIAYTLGASPLQQYLVPFRGGRYQALSIAWDTRRREQGGQRWFHLYPDQKIDHADLLHWTGPNQNWNFMCAECHSTNLKKNYRLDGNRYETTWSEIDVSCEACHGPGSRHVAWAEVARRGDEAEKEKTRGLLVVLKDRGTWVPDPEKGTARRASPPGPRREVEACARCHSRRVVIRADYVHGRPLLDTHRLALLREGLYHADGQLQEETYVYGSFLQSRMYRAGVTCSDCHEPHSLALRATGNAVCTQCHQATKFDTPSHHFHRPGSPGAACVECHMPVRTYMVVDPRRDHSLRFPRPDLSVRLGTPDPCTACHQDRAPGWAAETVASWYGSKRRSGPHFGDALHLGRSGHPGAEVALRELATNPEAPAIVRASAVPLLRRYPTPAALGVIRRALGDGDPLVRAAAVRALEITPPPDRLRLAAPLVSDPIRTVRIEAARVLAPVPASSMIPGERQDVERALAEYREAQLTNADRPESHLNLGLLHLERGELEQAERAYRTALKIDARFVAAYVNLADLRRQQGRDEEGERILRDALQVAPDNGDVHHALGLLLVRQRRLPEALQALERAADLQPEQARYSYAFGVALRSFGQHERAIAVLTQAHRRHPYDRGLLVELITLSRERGALDQALEYARTLVALSPRDQSAQQLLRQLEAERTR